MFLVGFFAGFPALSVILLTRLQACTTQLSWLCSRVSAQVGCEFPRVHPALLGQRSQFTCARVIIARPYLFSLSCAQFSFDISVPFRLDAATFAEEEYASFDGVVKVDLISRKLVKR